MIRSNKPTLLIISFSDISSDARVLKQVKMFKDAYCVTTASFGKAPEGVANHIEIPVGNTLQTVNGRYILAKQFRLAYWRIPTVNKAWQLLKKERGKFDIVLSNDLDAAPIGLRLKPRLGVHADLHEYYPALHEENASWVKFRQPWINWLIRHYVAKANSVSTVSHGLQKAYSDNFMLSPIYVPNATPYADLQVQEVSSPIKLVHSGAALRNRKLEIMLDAVKSASCDVTFDLYLTPNDPFYLSELREQYSSNRIIFHDPVPYSKLIPTLNCYDMGIHILAPINFNNEWALPNKIFDYTQARLGVIIGPSPEMKNLIDRCHNGVVADSFSAISLRETIESLNTAEVTRMKEASNRVARELSAEEQVLGWTQAIDAIAKSGR